MEVLVCVRFCVARGPHIEDPAIESCREDLCGACMISRTSCLEELQMDRRAGPCETVSYATEVTEYTTVYNAMVPAFIEETAAPQQREETEHPLPSWHDPMHPIFNLIVRIPHATPARRRSQCRKHRRPSVTEMRQFLSHPPLLLALAQLDGARVAAHKHAADAGPCHKPRGSGKKAQGVSRGDGTLRAVGVGEGSVCRRQELLR